MVTFTNEYEAFANWRRIGYWALQPFGGFIRILAMSPIAPNLTDLLIIDSEESTDLKNEAEAISKKKLMNVRLMYWMYVG